MYAFAFEIRSRITSPEDGGAACGAGVGATQSAAAVAINPTITSKTEVQNLLTFNGI
ncbi:MAG: hypothetical protein IPP63_01595 [Chloracidobacterium sp.]|nr:hypothetical protein [Chloracidobacterium sp.]